MPTQDDYAAALESANTAAAAALQDHGLDPDLVLVAAVVVHERRDPGPVYRLCLTRHPTRDAIAELPEGEHVLETFRRGLTSVLVSLKPPAPRQPRRRARPPV